MDTAREGMFEREPPTVSYRRRPGDGVTGVEAAPEGVPAAAAAAVAPAGAAPRTGRARIAQQAMEWITWTILGVCLVVWAVVGFVVWLPLLVRTMAVFSAALVQANLDGDQPTEAARTLRDAIDFYRRGFVITINALAGEPVGEARGRAVLDGRRLAREAVWALVVWYPLLVWFGAAWSPAELWTWLTAWPWGAWVDGFFASLWTLFD